MSDTPSSNYSRLDRLLHKWAFSGLELQKALADIEDRMHAGRIASLAIAKPIFITSLPRAGTTLLLELLADHPGFIAHTYRCMPFVLCPILWDSVSRGFRRPSESKERAHGDGMTVGYDSPEAFEEVLWTAFWKSKYRADRISLWLETDRNPEFEQFFRNHIRKLLALSAASNPDGMRYVSKNNANIARIPLLGRIFPDCRLLVTFRDPLDQAGSLFRQHKRFVKIHAEDPFTRTYMDSIGHFEFGAGLKQIDFPAVSGTGEFDDPMNSNFWLSYWLRAYRHLLSIKSAQLRFIDFDRMCAQPIPVLDALWTELGTDRLRASIKDDAARFHASVHYDPASLAFDPQLVALCRDLHSELCVRAIGQ